MAEKSGPIIRSAAELAEAVVEKIDHGLGRSVPKDTVIYTLDVSPHELRSITEVMQSAESGTHEQWTREMARALAERFGMVPTVQVRLDYLHGQPAAEAAEIIRNPGSVRMSTNAQPLNYADACALLRKVEAERDDLLAEREQARRVARRRADEQQSPGAIVALLDVAEAAQRHLDAADGLSLGADDEARNREVERAADLSNALYRLAQLNPSANPQDHPSPASRGAND